MGGHVSSAPKSEVYNPWPLWDEMASIVEVSLGDCGLGYPCH